MKCGYIFSNNDKTYHFSGFVFNSSDNDLYTTGNYIDRHWRENADLDSDDEKHVIPLHEFIEHICSVEGDVNIFLSDLEKIQEEVNRLPDHMKSEGTKVLDDWRKKHDTYRQLLRRFSWWG